MDLAVLAIQLLLATHPPMAHVEAVLDAPALEPRLSPNLDPEGRLQVRGQARLSRDSPVSLDIGQDATGHNQVILDFED